MLAGKTRVLVTHTLWCLPLAHDIMLMDGGRVAHQGNFQHLAASGVDFSAMAMEEVDDGYEQPRVTDVVTVPTPTSPDVDSKESPTPTSAKGSPVAQAAGECAFEFKCDDF